MACELSSKDEDAVIEEFQKWLAEKSPENLNLLITGKTGVGKSRLVNALVGKRVTEEGRKLDPCTSEVTSYQAVIEGVTVTVWDPPGLQDGTGNEDQYIRDMKEKIKDIDLMIYCVRMDEARFHTADKKAMRTLTDEFGKEVWNHAVVVLTFANKVEDPDGENNLEYFKSQLQEWEKQVEEYFTSIGIEVQIPVIPVGTKTKRADSIRLPDRENWLSHLWIECFQMMKAPNRRAMYRINRHRLRSKPSSVAQTSASAPTTATCDVDVLDKIPLDEKQQGYFFNLIIKAFLKVSANSPHQASGKLLKAAVIGTVVARVLGGRGGSAIGAVGGVLSKKLMEIIARHFGFTSIQCEKD